MNIDFSLKRLVLETLFPALCPVCRSCRVLENCLCPFCLKKMIPLPRFMLQKIQDEVQDLEDSPVFVLYIFNAVIQKLLHLLKYRNMKSIGFFLGQEMGKQMLKENMVDMDCIIPVPIHRTRQRERGYNQSTLLAEGISRVLKIPVRDNIIIRKRYTRSQTQLSREERQLNVKDSFFVVDPEKIKNRDIILVDDVITTGATINTCARELKKNGTGLVIKAAVATPTF